MVPESEDALVIGHVAERLMKAHPQLDPEQVRASVETAYEELRYARVRTYLPVLMEQSRVGGVVGCGPGGEGAAQQPVCGVDVAGAVEEVGRPGHRHGRRVRPGRRAPRGVEQMGHVPQVAAEVRAGAGRLGEAAGPLGGLGGEVGGAQQRGHRGGPVTAASDDAGCPFQ
ncbi:three-helix bundle dimerization domain-containing protein [Streptomyces nojiriensis]|uniref:three-helix bundle dimerization domain-containing protein n=1 Tax=Streptomyces nojiriensis TaxID=66374 RepID=UPI0035E1D773